MKILIAGQKHFGEVVYNEMISLGHEVVAVACPPQGDRLFFRAVERDSVPWIKKLTKDTMPEGVDLIVTAHSHDFISEQTRFRAKHGAIGYHPSLLPVHRGRDAIRWAIKNNEKITGGTVFWLSNQVDAGDIVCQEHCFIHPSDTPKTLWIEKLQPLGLKLLRRAVTEISNGVFTKIKQDEELATWEPSWERMPIARPDLLMIPHLRS
jgi:methionyl-tRNA formyltransferase